MEKTLLSQREGLCSHLLGDKLMLDVDALRILALPPTDVKLSVSLGLSPPSEHLFFEPRFDGIPSVSKKCSKNGRVKCAIDPFDYKNDRFFERFSHAWNGPKGPDPVANSFATNRNSNDIPDSRDSTHATRLALTPYSMDHR